MAKETFKVIGIEYKDYVSKRTQGYNRYTTQVFGADEKPAQLDGDCCFSFWIRPENMPEKELKVGEKVSFSYNKFGNVETVERAD